MALKYIKTLKGYTAEARFCAELDSETPIGTLPYEPGSPFTHVVSLWKGRRVVRIKFGRKCCIYEVPADAELGPLDA